MSVGSAPGKSPESVRCKLAGCKVAPLDGIIDKCKESVSNSAPGAVLVGSGVSAL